MKETKTFFTQEFYEKHLSTINNVHFTNREIDVIACLLNAWGAKKTALFLSISPKTVDSHRCNIMAKLECNTRQSIIDFLEASDKLTDLRAYYSLLQNEMIFEKSLKNISKLNKDGSPRCLLIQEKNKEPFILHLQSHLEFTGIRVSVVAREKKGEYTIFILPKILTEETVVSLLPKITKSQNKVLLLLPERKKSKEIPQELMKWEIVDFAKQENYFFSFFLILNKLLPHLDLEKTVGEFKANYKKVYTEYKLPQVSLNEKPSGNRFIYQRWTYFFLACFLITLMGSGLLVFEWNQKNNDAISLRSDLVIPMESAFLNRAELMEQINEAFKGKEGIQTVALVGVGGAGKTIAARQYAHKQKAPLIWEINAETKSNLIESFENLAYTLAKTDEDKRTLRDLTEVKNSSEREKKLVDFVKEHLRTQSNWFLIYDNVEKFTDVQKYFPLDPKTWGSGRVILTTRDSNFQNNKYVNYALQIGELNDNQKLNLFTKIMTQNAKNPFSSSQIEEAKQFLKNIPPFPLDVSVASYYIKTANISYEKYLENINKNNPDLTNVQNDILKESGGYTKTRYGIVTLSLQKLMESHKDFRDLLLFITLLDSQNVPRELLNKYKDDAIVDNFIYHLKKYSLITGDTSASPAESTFSIHRSTQDISFAYLTELLKLNKDSQVVKDITYALDDYVDQAIEQEDFSRMHIMASHLKKFLNHPDLLAEFSKGLLESKLGSVYYFINDDKSKQMLEDSLSILEKKSLDPLSSTDTSRLARSFLHIGAVYTELRLDKDAQALLEKAVYLYRNEGSKHYADLSWALSYLGNIHRKLGNYAKARDCLEESLHLNKQYGTDKKRMVRTLAYLGSTYRGFGAYQKAIDILKESLVLYKKQYSHDHFRVGWILVQLGNVHRDLGDPQKAKGFLEAGLLIFQKHLSDNHVNLGLAFAYLGNCYRELGEYERSRHYLEQSLRIYQKSFDNQHVKMGWLLFQLASTYKALGQSQEAQKLFDEVLKIYAKDCGEDNIEKARLLGSMAKIYLEKNLLNEAENFSKKSLRILQSYHHVEAYIALKTLGEIFLEKSTLAKEKGEIQSLKNQAINKFREALTIAEQYFPKGSMVLQEMEDKIKEIKCKI